MCSNTCSSKARWLTRPSNEDLLARVQGHGRAETVAVTPGRNSVLLVTPAGHIYVWLFLKHLN